MVDNKVSLRNFDQFILTFSCLNVPFFLVITDKRLPNLCADRRPKPLSPRGKRLNRSVTMPFSLIHRLHDLDIVSQPALTFSMFIPKPLSLISILPLSNSPFSSYSAQLGSISISTILASAS